MSTASGCRAGPVYSKAGHDDVLAGRQRASTGARPTTTIRPRSAIMQVVYEGLQLPMDHGAAGRVALVREDPALAGSGGDDPLAVRLDAGAQQGRAPAGRRAGQADQEDRHHRRRLHGRGHRLCQRARRHRRGADRPRSGSGRQGQGAFAEARHRPGQSRPRHGRRPRRAAGAHHGYPRLLRRSRTATSSSRRYSRTARSRPR